MNYNIIKKDQNASYNLRVARCKNHLMGMSVICRNNNDYKIGNRIVHKLDEIFEVDMKNGNYHINEQVRKIVSEFDKNTELVIFTFVDDYCHKYTVGHDINCAILSQEQQSPIMSDVTIYARNDIRCIKSSGKWCKDDIFMITSNNDQALQNQLQDELICNNGNFTNLTTKIHDNTVIMFTRKDV